MSIFLFGKNYWIWRKKIGLLTFLGLSSLLGRNFIKKSFQDNDSRHKDEISILQKKVEELPELYNQLQEKKALEKKLLTKCLNMEDDIKNLILEIADLKNQQTEKNEKINSLTDRIDDFKIRSDKDDLALSNYQKDIKENDKKFQRWMETKRKDEDDHSKEINKLKEDLSNIKYRLNQKEKEVENYQQELKSKISELKLIQKDLQENREKYQQKELELERSNIQVKELKEKLTEIEKELQEKKKELEEYVEKMATIHSELTVMKEILDNIKNNLEKKDQMDLVRSYLNQMIQNIAIPVIMKKFYR